MDTTMDGARVFAQIAKDLVGRTGVRETSARAVDLAQDLSGCDLATVWHLSEHRAGHLNAATNEAQASALQRIVAASSHEFGWRSLEGVTTIRVEDFLDDDRWPDYRRLLIESGLEIRSAVAYPLFAGDRKHGVLTLYSGKPSYFRDEVTEVGGLLAQHVTVALDAAAGLEAAENLRRALQSNRQIGMAIGILMAEHKIRDPEAFDLLRIASQNTHIKMRDLAEEVVLTGRLPRGLSRPQDLLSKSA
jgi:GAF domain-containing protein